MAHDTAKFWRLLRQVTINDPSLTTLVLLDAGLNQDDLIRLSEALIGNTHITELDLGYNGIADDGANVLMAAIAQNQTLTTLRLGGNNIGPEGAIALAQNNTITTLALGNNNIGPEGARALAQNRNITTLGLSHSNIGPEGAIALAQNRTITTLYLSENNIGSEGARALAQNNTITTLNLADNGIGPDGAIALAQNRTITTLYLNDNNIDPEGAIELAQNNTITTLDLSENNIGSEGARALAQNNTITTLNLAINKIGADGAIALALNNTLRTLNLNTNKIGPAGASALAQNNTLRTLYLASNKIGPEGTSALAQNNTIMALDLNYNNIDLEGCTAYLEALKKNTSLIHFEWYDKNYLISRDIRVAIEEELKINKACRQVIKEHIHTLANIRSLEPTNLLALMPIELMFLFFKELMPGFNPDTFAQTNIPPADAVTLAKARDKLKAIAAQQGLSIHLELSINASGSDSEKNNTLTTVCQALRLAPLPTHFYAVTEQTLLAREDKTKFSLEEQHQLLQPTNRCFLYSTAEQAQTRLRNMAKPAGFFRTTTPLLLRVATNASLADFTEGMPVECRQLNTIMSYRQGAALEQAELLQAHQEAQQIKQLVTQAYQEYVTTSTHSTSISSSPLPYTISTTSQLVPTHGRDKLARALACQESLADLAYPELIQAIKAYAAGLNDHFEPDKSFMVMLYQHFIQHYGTQAQRDNLPTATINKESLLDAIAQIEQAVKQQVLSGFNQEISQPPVLISRQSRRG